MEAPIPLTPSTPEGVVRAYLEELAARSGSSRTPTEYERYIRRFMQIVPDPSSAAPAHVHAFAYAVGPSGRKPSAGTVGVHLNAIKGFYDFCRRMQLVPANPAEEVKRPRPLRPTPRGLTAAEAQRLLAAVPATVVGQRDRAIILTALLTGLRRAELLALCAGDLTEADGRIFFRVRAKGGVMRHRELPAPAFRAISDGLLAEGRPLLRLHERDRIFAVSIQGFYLNLRRNARKACLAGVSPHVLRHSAAKLRRDGGASLEDVQSLLGHASVATTARYLQRMEGVHDDGWHTVAKALGCT